MTRPARDSILAALALTAAGLWGCAARAEMLDGRRLHVIDGDTVRLSRAETIRILNIDAPETRGARCERELIMGLRAKERLRALLAGPIRIERCEPSGRCRDRYGRTLARLVTATGDAGLQLIAEGHALPWAPGPEAKAARIAAWCGRTR